MPNDQLQPTPTNYKFTTSLLLTARSARIQKLTAAIEQIDWKHQKQLKKLIQRQNIQDPGVPELEYQLSSTISELTRRSQLRRAEKTANYNKDRVLWREQRLHSDSVFGSAKTIDTEVDTPVCIDVCEERESGRWRLWFDLGGLILSNLTAIGKWRSGKDEMKESCGELPEKGFWG